MTPHHVFGLWKSLMVDCQTGVEPAVFNRRQGEIANLYKALGKGDKAKQAALQGEYHHLIFLDHNEWKAAGCPLPEAA